MTPATLFAWLVHAYTALGLVCAAVIAALIMQGDDTSFRWAFWVMMLATAVDATDGFLARRARVKEVLPDFDGGALDNLIDFQTYTTLPLLLLWQAQVLPGASAWILLAPLLASAYGFSQVHAKTREGFFLGFPSYWNIVAYYLYVLKTSPPVAATLLIVFSVLTFVPTYYLYASRGGPFARTINIGSAIWFVALSVVLLDTTGRWPWLGYASLAYPVLYLGLSAIVTVRVTRARRLRRGGDAASG
jgi:phosphatidylcholine synthase